MSAKDLVIRPIDSKTARQGVKEWHYSGKPVNNSSLNFGVYWHGKLEGVMQFGPPLDKRKLLGLVEGTGWSQMLELNRMAFSDRLPKNSESRALSVAFRLIRKHAPHIKWIVSFSDGTQSGDGTIYRATGFKLTMIKKSENLARFPNGEVAHKITFISGPLGKRSCLGGRSYVDVVGGGRNNWNEFVRKAGGEILPGFQLRYIKILDKDWENRLNCPVLPYSAIDEAGARMYRGKKPS